MKNFIKEISQKLKDPNNIIYSIFFLFFIIYLSTLKLRPYPFSYLVKIVPILSLAIIAYKKIPGLRGKYVFVGLLFSAVGDVFLALDGKNYFIIGLAAFGIAHILYILSFLRNPVYKKPRIFVIFVFLIYGVFIWSLLHASLGKMLIPVTIYISLITFMGFSAVLGKANHYLIIIGAALFIISDSTIAVNMYLLKVPNSSLWIMLTYYPAQFLITYGSTRK